jgi:hypothetical protein
VREAFISKRFRAASREIIDKAVEIADQYAADGYNLTLRQLYYQFVARGLLANNDRNYKNLGGLVNDARLAGIMDWSRIQDRTRQVNGSFGGWADPGHYLDNVASRYFEAIWEGQAYRPEVWVEKEALADVVAQATAPDRVPYFACRGYVSQTAMYDAAKRFQQRRAADQQPVLIHLGDHDPSGIDMTRDIEDRLALMSWGSVPVLRIALNMDQIEEYNPPPNPAKITDSRAQSYIARFGTTSWELDALDPATLTALIRDTLETYIDRDLLEERRTHEAEQEQRIREVAERFGDLSENWSEVLDVIGVE